MIHVYLFSKNKGADQLCVYLADDLRLCFFICKKKFSLDAPHIIFLQCRNSSLDELPELSDMIFIPQEHASIGCCKTFPNFLLCSWGSCFSFLTIG